MKMAKKNAAVATMIAPTLVGRNVMMSLDGTKLTIEVDLDEKAEPSMSGKTLIVATTQGNQEFAGVRVGLNIYKYAQPKVKGK
jgi:hypothetical protein